MSLHSELEQADFEFAAGSIVRIAIIVGVGGERMRRSRSRRFVDRVEFKSREL